MKLRKVIVSKHVMHAQEGSRPARYELEPQGEALFHQFGVGYEEFESGPGNFTTAIVEWPDGRIESVVVDHVRFVTPRTGMTPVRGSSLGSLISNTLADIRVEFIEDAQMMSDSELLRLPNFGRTSLARLRAWTHPDA
jgi:hypothetical protein